MERLDVDAIVRSHHDALEAWLARGDRSQFDWFLDAHDEDFTLVTVGGANLDLSSLRDGLAAAGGSQPALRLDVDDIRVLAETDEMVVVRFLETHRRTNEREPASQRWTTAVLRHRSGGGWRWLTVHETAPRD